MILDHLENDTLRCEAEAAATKVFVLFVRTGGKQLLVEPRALQKSPSGQPVAIG